MTQTDILIIGGGLAGLTLAEQFERAGAEYQLVEARERLGGRILTHEQDDAAFDLGPAWFWPGQPRMEALIRRLNLQVFEQYSTGDIVSEDENGQVQRGCGFASMQGSNRVAGGLGRLIDGLASSIPADRICLRSNVQSLVRKQDGLDALIATEGRQWTIKAKHIVLALPPRVAEACLSFAPNLSSAQKRAMAEIPTWMAGQAKILAVFDRPYWRERGLSGDAMSRHGPMVEMHDASPVEGGPHALFGFVGIPAAARLAHKSTVLDLARGQLCRLFGDDLADPLAIIIKDWADDPLTATKADQRPDSHHPIYGYPTPLEGLWDGRLMFCSTEVGSQYGGYLEGALEAAELAFDRLTQETLQKTVALS